MTRIFNLSWSKDCRKDLRRQATVEETMLWNLLKNKQLSGEKFRRQHGIGPYISDFYCARIKLVIEVDGDVHADTVEYDAERDAYLRGAGCKVLHFSNKMIREHIQEVMNVIRSEIASSPCQGG